jgi:N,N'-diacetyllegionaminate synthase
LSPRVVVIAEAGVNHNGDLDTAKALIDVAVKAGADFVKFQTFTADTLATPDAPTARYQKKAMENSQDTQKSMLSKLELSESQHIELKTYAEAKGISFLSTGFDIASIDLLYRLGIRLFKIPSGELTNLPFLEHIASLGCPVYLSTGMATLEEVRWAVDSLVQAGQDREKISILHCTTSYPTPLDQANLLAIKTLSSELGLTVGYSDHTLGTEASIAAVALGALIIEKHFTLSRDQAGPDHKASLEPDELESLINSIRALENSWGDGIKAPQDCELENIPIARKSIVARKSIARGELFSPENLTTKRPGTGLSPIHWQEVIGRRAMRDFMPEEGIEIE